MGASLGSLLAVHWPNFEAGHTSPDFLFSRPVAREF